MKPSTRRDDIARRRRPISAVVIINSRAIAIDFDADHIHSIENSGDEQFTINEIIGIFLRFYSGRIRNRQPTIR